MASKFKTRLGLPKWVLSDKPNMKDFNDAFEVIDGELEKKANNNNLLDNWDFREPYRIVQRVIPKIVTEPGYFIDRWKLESGTVTLEENGLKLSGTIAQKLESSAGNNVTPSVKMYNGTANSAYDNETKILSISSDGGTIAAAKLEYGTASTLESDPPMNYASELLKCQRYQYVVKGQQSFFAFIEDENTALAVVKTPVPLRATPIMIGGSFWMARNPAAIWQTDWTYSFHTRQGDSLQVRAEKASHGLSLIGSMVLGNVIFDANL